MLPSTIDTVLANINFDFNPPASKIQRTSSDDTKDSEVSDELETLSEQIVRLLDDDLIPNMLSSSIFADEMCKFLTRWCNARKSNCSSSATWAKGLEFFGIQTTPDNLVVWEQRESLSVMLNKLRWDPTYPTRWVVNLDLIDKSIESKTLFFNICRLLDLCSKAYIKEDCMRNKVWSKYRPPEVYKWKKTISSDTEDIEESDDESDESDDENDEGDAIEDYEETIVDENGDVYFLKQTAEPSSFIPVEWPDLVPSLKMLFFALTVWARDNHKAENEDETMRYLRVQRRNWIHCISFYPPYRMNKSLDKRLGFVNEWDPELEAECNDSVAAKVKEPEARSLLALPLNLLICNLDVIEPKGSFMNLPLHEDIPELTFQYIYDAARDAAQNATQNAESPSAPISPIPPIPPLFEKYAIPCQSSYDNTPFVNNHILNSHARVGNSLYDMYTKTFAVLTTQKFYRNKRVQQRPLLRKLYIQYLHTPDMYATVRHPFVHLFQGELDYDTASDMARSFFFRCNNPLQAPYENEVEIELDKIIDDGDLEDDDEDDDMDDDEDDEDDEDVDKQNSVAHQGSMRVEPYRKKMQTLYIASRIGLNLKKESLPLDILEAQDTVTTYFKRALNERRCLQRVMEAAYKRFGGEVGIVWVAEEIDKLMIKDAMNAPGNDESSRQKRAMANQALCLRNRAHAQTALDRNPFRLGGWILTDELFTKLLNELMSEWKQDSLALDELMRRK